MKGHFYKKDNTWRFIMDIGVDPATGKRKQTHRGGFKTKKEAEAAAAKLLVESETGYTKERKVTVNDFAQEWLELYENTGHVKVSTIAKRKYEISILIAQMGAVKISDVTKKMYQDFLLALKAKGLSKNTMIGINSTSKMVFKNAVELDVIKSDPTQYAKLPTVQKTVQELEAETAAHKYLEKEELLHFLEIAKTHGLDQDYYMFLTLAYTGLRIGELCALKWSDIDFDTCEIRVSKTLHMPSRVTDYVLLTPKTPTSRRTILVDSIVINELQKHKNQQNAFKLKYRNVYMDAGFIFTQTINNKGYPYDTKRIDRRMHRLTKFAGLNDNLTPHSLRHTHVSLLAQAGAGMEEIMERLGHKDDTITREIYLHVTKKMKKDASQKFSQLMRSI